MQFSRSDLETSVLNSALCDCSLMKVSICKIPAGDLFKKEFKCLNDALHAITPVKDKTDKKYLNLSIVVKNPSLNSEITKVILEPATENDKKVLRTNNFDENHDFKTDKTVLLSETGNSANPSTNNNLEYNKHVLFLVNPVSGRKKGKKTIDRIEPLLKILKVNYTIVLTRSQNHIAEMNFAPYSKIIFVSGDGLIFDYVQVAVKKKLLHIPIAILKCGTGNALATAIDALDPDIALLSSLYGSCRPLDLTKYTFLSKDFFSFLGLFWGLIADIDLGSERFRCMGMLRTEIAAVYYLLKKRKYRAKLTYKEDAVMIEKEVDLTCFMAMSLPFLDEEHFGCPDARLNDNRIHIVHDNLSIKKGIGLLTNGRNPEKFRKMNWNYLTTSEFTLSPIGKKSFMDLDGEFMEYGFLSAVVCNSTMKIMTPEWLDEDIMTGSSKFK